MPPTIVVRSAPAKFAKKTRRDKIKPFVGIFGIAILDFYFVYITRIHVDLLTSVALITLLFMMEQTEHERCDRVRAGWREIRRANFGSTSAIQTAALKPEYENAARAAVQDFYATVLLYGQGSLLEEYREKFNELAARQPRPTLMQMLPVFEVLDNKTVEKFDTWKLVWL